MVPVKDLSMRGRATVRFTGSEEATGGLAFDACPLVDAMLVVDDGPAWGIVGIGMPSNLGSGIGVKSRSRRRLLDDRPLWVLPRIGTGGCSGRRCS